MMENRTYFILFLLMLLPSLVIGQKWNEGIDYQGVLRDASGNEVKSKTVSLHLSIISDSLLGNEVFVENHTTSTNEKGHFRIVIGKGNFVSGSSSRLIDLNWSSDMFLNVQVDLNNGTNYKDLGTSQFGAVPYSFTSYKTAQKFDLNGLLDVDTTGLKNGYVLKWNNGKWSPSPDSVLSGTINPDTVNFALKGQRAIKSDTSLITLNCINTIPSDSAKYSEKSDSSWYSDSSSFAIKSNHAKLSDSSSVAYRALGYWSVNGDSNLSNNRLGNKTNTPLVFMTNNSERVRIDTNGFVGIGTNSPLTDLHIQGSKGLLITGDTSSSIAPIHSGPAKTMFYYPAKSAFRIGEVSGNHWDNFRIGKHSFAGGQNTIASGVGSMAYGYGSQANGESSVALGFICVANGFASFASANECRANGVGSIAMGRASWSYDSASVALGYTLSARGKASIALGYHSRTNADYCVAMGSYSKADHLGSFVYTDASSLGTQFGTTGPNQFRVKASGGVFFYTNAAATAGVRLASGSGSWSTLSDRRRKENIHEINYLDVLSKLSEVPVYRWNYKTQNSSIEHLGPMAQDFYGAFKLGESDKHISSVDIDGVNMAAIKGLQIKLRELEKSKKEIEILNAQIHDYKIKQKELESLIQEFEKYLLKAEN